MVDIDPTTLANSNTTSCSSPCTSNGSRTICTNDSHRQLSPTNSPNTGSMDDDRNNSNNKEPPATTPANFMALPTEVRQRIFSTVCGDLCPLSRSNAAWLAAQPQSRHERAAIANAPFTRLDDTEKSAYARFGQLYSINSRTRAEMQHVERIWLTKRFPLSLASFAEFAERPKYVGGVLTLAIFDEDFIRRPPAEWVDVVDAVEDLFSNRVNLLSPSFVECAEYLSIWCNFVKRLPLKGASSLGIERVEIVETRIRLRNRVWSEGYFGGYIRIGSLVRLKILLMTRLGLKTEKVMITGKQWEGKMGYVQYQI